MQPHHLTYPHSENNIANMAQILSDDANSEAHVSAQLKCQLKLGSRLIDPANTEHPELSYQKRAINALAHHKDTTGSKCPANPTMINLLDSNSDNNNNNIKSTELGGNIVFFYTY